MGNLLILAGIGVVYLSPYESLLNMAGVLVFFTGLTLLIAKAEKRRIYGYQ
jgi:hypothetical protein